MTGDERADVQAPVSEPQVPDPLIDMISKVVTKALSGHWIGQVNAADLASQVLADAVLCHTLGASTDWAQDTLRTKVIGTLRVSDKRKLFEEALRHLGMEAGDLASAMEALTALTTLRNTMAHSAINLGLEGLLFEGYNRGRDTFKEIPPEEIMAIIEAAQRGGRAISTSWKPTGCPGRHGSEPIQTKHGGRPYAVKMARRRLTPKGRATTPSITAGMKNHRTKPW